MNTEVGAKSRTVSFYPLHIRIIKGHQKTTGFTFSRAIQSILENFEQFKSNSDAKTATHKQSTS